VALLAAMFLVLVAAFSAHGPFAAEPAGLVAAVPFGDGSGSISASPRTKAIVTAVEPRQSVSLVRSEGRQPLRAHSTFLVAVVLLAAALGWRGLRGLRRELELSIRAQSEWWRPAPGRRAPPRAMTT